MWLMLLYVVAAAKKTQEVLQFGNQQNRQADTRNYARAEKRRECSRPPRPPPSPPAWRESLERYKTTSQTPRRPRDNCEWIYFRNSRCCYLVSIDSRRSIHQPINHNIITHAYPNTSAATTGGYRFSALSIVFVFQRHLMITTTQNRCPKSATPLTVIRRRPDTKRPPKSFTTQVRRIVLNR